jgi:hypothetical protein
MAERVHAHLAAVFSETRVTVYWVYGFGGGVFDYPFADWRWPNDD